MFSYAILKLDFNMTVQLIKFMTLFVLTLGISHSTLTQSYICINFYAFCVKVTEK